MMESNDSPEIPDRGETSEEPGLPSVLLSFLNNSSESNELNKAGIPAHNYGGCVLQTHLGTQSFKPELSSFRRWSYKGVFPFIHALLCKPVLSRTHTPSSDCCPLLFLFLSLPLLVIS